GWAAPAAPGQDGPGGAPRTVSWRPSLRGRAVRPRGRQGRAAAGSRSGSAGSAGAGRARRAPRRAGAVTTAPRTSTTRNASREPTATVAPSPDGRPEAARKTAPRPPGPAGPGPGADPAGHRTAGAMP